MNKIYSRKLAKNMKSTKNKPFDIDINLTA